MRTKKLTNGGELNSHGENGSGERGNSSEESLEKIFRPKSVALVGVSGRSESQMARPLRYLREHGYTGKVYPVNPNYKELDGVKCYPSLSAVPKGVDLVLVMVSASNVIDIVFQSGQIGAYGVVVFASGFAETGAKGARLQSELLEAGRLAGVRILGPNCQGLMYTPVGLCATFTAAADRPLNGTSGVAYVGQSGAVGGSILDLATEMGLGMTAWVSTGNQADLGLVEIGQHLLRDSSVNVLMLYMEATADKVAYTKLCQQAKAAGKKIVLLRSGKSIAGRRAAEAHTGSIVTDDNEFELTSEKYGVYIVDDVNELLSVAAMITSMPLAKGPRLAVITTSGGAGILAADHFEGVALGLNDLTIETQERLAPLIPDFGSLNNPVDVTAQLFNHGAHAFGEVCRIVSDDPGVDAIAVLITMVVGEAGVHLAEDLMETAKGLSKPIYVVWLAGNELTRGGREVFRNNGVPLFSSVTGLARVAKITLPVNQLDQPQV